MKREPLIVLCNLLLKIVSVVEDWKLAKVVPMFKKKRSVELDMQVFPLCYSCLLLVQLTIWLYLNSIWIDQPYQVIQITLTVLISLFILCSYSKFFISGFIFISRSSIKMLNSLICMTVLSTQNGPIQYWFFFWQLLFKIQLTGWFLIQTVLLFPRDTFFRNVVCWQVKGSKEF